MNQYQKKKMRLGRRSAYLNRCVLAMQLLEDFESDTSIRKAVFEKHIQPVLRCSYTTFNNMLNEPNPQRQLEDIERQLNELNN